MDDQSRKEILAGAIAERARRGMRVESQTDYQAVMVKGHRPSHVLHLILTLLTLGAWVIVWLALAILGGEKRRIVSVDPDGNVVERKP